MVLCGLPIHIENIGQLFSVFAFVVAAFILYSKYLYKKITLFSKKYGKC
jgi:hypothetical protein